jgi:hypothetical protein
MEEAVGMVQILVETEEQLSHSMEVLMAVEVVEADKLIQHLEAVRVRVQEVKMCQADRQQQIQGLVAVEVLQEDREGLVLS